MNGLRLPSLLEKIDIFGRPLPTFNLNSNTEVNTVTGGLVTFAIIITVLCYGSLKYFHLLTKHNANVTSVLDTDVFDFNDKINLNEIGFRFAFSVRGVSGKKDLKDDPRHVKYIVRMDGFKGGEKFDRIIPYHLCTDEDWDKFPPPTKDASVSIAPILSGEYGGMYCLDWEDDIENMLIYGNRNNDEYQKIEILLVPCNYLHSKNDSIPEECEADKDAMEDYLGTI